DESRSSLALVRAGAVEPLKQGDDAYISSRADPQPAVEAPLVFVGYGLSVPEMHHDDFAGMDLRGKIVVYISGGPSNIPGPLRAQSVVERSEVESQNVAGVLPGTDPELKKEYVVLSAHLDHLGVGEPIYPRRSHL